MKLQPSRPSCVELLSDMKNFSAPELPPLTPKAYQLASFAFAGAPTPLSSRRAHGRSYMLLKYRILTEVVIPSSTRAPRSHSREGPCTSLLSSPVTAVVGGAVLRDLYSPRKGNLQHNRSRVHNEFQRTEALHLQMASKRQRTKGYGMECRISMRGTGTRLAEAGYAVYGMDYEGHGKSSGLQGYIPSFNNLVNDCSNYFSSICALTGESLPVTKKTGDHVFSGSTCKHGEIEAVVIATGVHSFFGKAAHFVDSTVVIGHFQKVLTSIGNFCICSIAIGMLLEIIVMFPIQHRSYRDGINNLLVSLIPVAISFTQFPFTSGYEAGINRSNIDGKNLIPHGALVTFVQKGLQYIELEANLASVGVCVPFCQMECYIHSSLDFSYRDFVALLCGVCMDF
ncbi:hypothetical protein J5N97_004320 [Dioscorea zingiberensis]|uniref:Serine aminopeptidase S33 domain-containing protein n=1 Tax=Dioscorea zingiberensis TaxID=325984 RepID=A0A9D5D719_9LILI|nr:hypothetical protein J5N97_004320 [Dioscorea zingiberensis]